MYKIIHSYIIPPFLLYKFPNNGNKYKLKLKHGILQNIQQLKIKTTDNPVIPSDQKLSKRAKSDHPPTLLPTQFSKTSFKELQC